MYKTLTEITDAIGQDREIYNTEKLLKIHKVCVALTEDPGRNVFINIDEYAVYMYVFTEKQLLGQHEKFEELLVSYLWSKSITDVDIDFLEEEIVQINQINQIN